MAKQAKKTQTDYTIGGRDISNTAIPLYQSSLTQLSDWTLNPQQQADELMNKYFSGNVQQSDLLRNYQRAMGNVTANNYAATHGGYSSSGDMARMDQQRNWNDLVARTQGQNVANAFSIANANIGNLGNALNQYNAAYGKGKEYSDVEQYNYMADQNNSFGNQLLQAAPAIGSLGGAVIGTMAGNPTLGASLGSQLGQGIAGTSAIGGTSGADNPWTGLATGIYDTTVTSPNSWMNLFGGNKNTKAANKHGLTVGTDLSGKTTLTNKDGLTLRGYN